MSAGDDKPYIFDDPEQVRKAADVAYWWLGWFAQSEGASFNDGPKPLDSVPAISWRKGWTARAQLPVATNST